MTEQKRQSKGCVILGIFLFAFPIIAALFLLFVLPAYKTLSAVRWSKVECKVIRAEVVSEGNSGRHMTEPVYRIDVEFLYEFEGQHYSSSRYDFSNGATGGTHRKRRIVEQLKSDNQTACFVNPRNPSQAVLNRGLPTSAWITGFISLTVVFGGAFTTKYLGIRFGAPQT